MRCTSCSKIVKPIVAIDIDGTLGDYHGHFMKFAGNFTGNLADAPYDSTEPFRDYVSRELNISVEEFRSIKLAYRQGGMKRSMPIYAGAVTLTKTVRRLGAELWLTTTRPYLRLDNIDPDTRAWLQRHDIEFDGLLYDEFKYKRLNEIVDHGRVIAVLDDLYEMIDAAEDSFGPTVPIHRKNKYNDHYKLSVSSLSEANELISERILSWDGRTGHE